MPACGRGTAWRVCASVSCSGCNGRTLICTKACCTSAVSSRAWTNTPPKTKAALRRIPLSEEMSKHLAALKLRSPHSKDNGPVFAARNGKPLKHRNATRRGFEAAAKYAEIDDVSLTDAPCLRLAHDRPGHLLDRVGRAHGA